MSYPSSGSVANTGSAPSESQRTTSFVGIDPTTRASIPYRPRGDRCECGQRLPASTARCRRCGRVRNMGPPPWSLMGVSQGAGDSYGAGDRSGSFLGKGHLKGTPEHDAWLAKFKASREKKKKIAEAKPATSVGEEKPKTEYDEEIRSPKKLTHFPDHSHSAKQRIAANSPKLSYDEGLIAISSTSRRLKHLAPHHEKHFKEDRDWFWDRADASHSDPKDFSFHTHHLHHRHLAAFEAGLRNNQHPEAKAVHAKIKQAMNAQLTNKPLTKALLWFEYAEYRLTH